MANPKYAIESAGTIAFGIKLYDQLNEVHNKCGVREIKLYENNALIYHHTMDKVAFSQKRYINAFADYREKTKNNSWVHQSFILPNNKLDVYNIKASGITQVPVGQVNDYRYVVTDFSGNESIGSFEVKGVAKINSGDAILKQKSAKHFKYDQGNGSESGDVMV